MGLNKQYHVKVCKLVNHLLARAKTLHMSVTWRGEFLGSMPIYLVIVSCNLLLVITLTYFISFNYSVTEYRACARDTFKRSSQHQYG